LFEIFIFGAADLRAAGFAALAFTIGFLRDASFAALLRADFFANVDLLADLRAELLIGLDLPADFFAALVLLFTCLRAAIFASSVSAITSRASGAFSSI
jgi:hypothetical protein